MRKFPISWRRVTFLVGALLLVLMILDFNSRLENLNRLNKQAELVYAEATQAALTQVMLHTQVAYATSDLAVEDNARGESRMKKDGDQVVVVIGQAGESPIETLTPTPVPTSKPNWQSWQDLFFGEE